MQRKLRNLFDHYDKQEDHITYALLVVLDENRNLLKRILQKYDIKLGSGQIKLLTQIAPRKSREQDTRPDGYIYSDDYENILEMFYHHYGRETSGKKLSGIRRGLQETGIRCPDNLDQMTEDKRDEFLISKLKEKNIKLINPNTGGTGCYCPHKEATPHLINTIIRKIVNPGCYVTCCQIATTLYIIKTYKNPTSS